MMVVLVTATVIAILYFAREVFVPITLAILLSFSFATGQTVTGSITGQVTDPSGAVVVGATVTAENSATGIRTPVQTNGSGVYTIRFLPVGTYTVTIEATGFITQAPRSACARSDPSQAGRRPRRRTRTRRRRPCRRTPA